MLWEPGWCPKILCMREGEAYQDGLDFSLSFSSTSAKATLILKCFKQLPFFPQIPSITSDKISQNPSPSWNIALQFITTVLC